jgi:hypothetical protein
MVSILLYTGKPKRLAGRLRKIIEAEAAGREIVVCSDFEELSARLHQSVYDVDAAVLLLSTRKELEAMLSRKESLWGLRVILVLPHEDRDTISKAHRLSPRFIGFVDKGFTDVAAVLAKMLESSDKIRKTDKCIQTSR